MGSRHTPGPWSWWTSNSWRRLSAVGDGDVLCPMVSVSDGHPDLLVSEANARLIAAAPELLEALVRVVDSMPFGDEPEYAIKAIAKAKGEA